MPFKNSSLSSDYCFSVKRKNASQVTNPINFFQPNSGIILTAREDAIFTAEKGKGELSIVSPKTFTKISTLHRPISIYRTTGRLGNVVFIIDSAGKALYAIDVKSNIIKARLELKSAPQAMALTSDEKKIYVSYFDTASRGKISVIDAMSLKQTATFTIEGRTAGIILSSNGRSLYASAAGSPFSGVWVIDTKSGKMVRNVAIPVAGNGIGISPDDKKLYVSTKDNNGRYQTSILDASSLKVLNTLPYKASFLAFNLESRFAFIVGETEIVQVGVIDQKVLNKFPFATSIQGAAVAHDGSVLVWLPKENRTFLLDVSQQTAKKEIYDAETIISRFKEQYKSDFTVARFRMADSLTHVLMDQINIAVGKLSADLGGPFTTIQTGFSFVRDQMMYINEYGIVNKLDDSKRILPKQEFRFTEGVILVTFRDPVTKGEALFKTPTLLRIGPVFMNL